MNPLSSMPLLSTKLFIPPIRPDQVLRPRLIDRLNQGLHRKLLLISAPAGFGKTTLVSAWRNESEIPFCWVTQDESDNDIGRFLAYFIAALQSLDIDADEQLLTLIQPPRPSPIESILIPLINQITSSHQEFVMVLDDYHLIQNPEIHDLLTFMLDRGPPAMHLVIATREDPPLPLARFRGRGEMMEIRATDLRFSVSEGEILLNQIQGNELSKDSIETLINRADGWVTALQMVSIALKDKPDPAGYIRDLSGNQSYIADYLTDEVIYQQPDEIKDFLIKTSILDRLSGSLCHAITRQENSQAILKHLRDSNLFLSSLDDENCWFRYHRLFASLLHQRLLETQPKMIPALYLKASQWFDANGYPTEAIDYAFRGGHVVRAIDLIEIHARATIRRSEISTFIHWVEKLPEDLVHEKPSLGILYALAVLVNRGDKQIAHAFVDRITPEDDHLAGQLNTVKVMLAIFDGQISNGVELARQAMKHLPPEDLFFRTIAAWNLSGALALSGKPEEGVKVLEEVIDTSLVSHNYLIAIIALCRVASAEVQKGKLKAAKGMFEQAIDIATTDQKRPLPAAAEALMGLGNIYWEWYQFEPARKHLLESINLSKRWREFTIIDSYVSLAHIRQSQGDAQGANQMMADALRIAAQYSATEKDDRYVASQQAHLRVRQGDLKAAWRWATGLSLEGYIGAKKLDLTGSLGEDIILRFELIVFARLLIAEKQYGKALSLLNLLLPSLEELGFLNKILETHILMAIGMVGQGNVKRAISSLSMAINLAEPSGYSRIFLDEGQVMIKLLREYKAGRDKNEFADMLLNTRTHITEKSEIPPETVDPLSEREIEILRLLATDLSAPEIAEHLFIAVSTIRTHTKNIYSKLGVHSRFEAISKAKERNLL
jgi:LuxR family maltose regulon positive regulatory protein